MGWRVKLCGGQAGEAKAKEKAKALAPVPIRVYILHKQ